MRLLNRQHHRLPPGEWIGLFTDPTSCLPSWVAKTDFGFQPFPFPRAQPITVLNRTPLYNIGATSQQLLRREWPDDLEGDTDYVGAVQHVRVVTLLRGPHKDPCHLYVDFLTGLNFDPARWLWRDQTPLLAYTAKQGRTLLRATRQLSTPIAAKWPGLLPQTFKAEWQDVWRPVRPQKDAAFLWSIYHKAVAVNSWRHQIDPGIDPICSLCQREEETLLHRFHSCQATLALWNQAQSAIHLFAAEPLGPHPRFPWFLCIFGKGLPRRYRPFTHLWSLLRGTVMWTAWLRRNALVFQDAWWSTDHSNQRLWECLIDYGRRALLKAHHTGGSQPQQRARLLQKFEEQWAFSPALGDFSNGSMKWNLLPPRVGFFI
ncbi:hypothetical protein KC19_12G149200 [Ceratodon purpureus]|uniref:Reverse transcriptase zinc-binding domain-containing protein n=1 Tax=Ceratodon purpureus TaxID=3225 RepID=A0A8T0G9M1_CERPU|nr:hypothetical protein KC19_12G149200 [Ceratodon purpureus]